MTTLKKGFSMRIAWMGPYIWIFIGLSDMFPDEAVTVIYGSRSQDF